ncbi:MAG: type II toxin-antitoxin system Phd/YefM family antitoxin [Moorea sp. SIO1F2]|uniref:type II toxin-antitoxin system Phd/YefM family antitoxin n=1 Tax=Moorena sp. SIO1F2 TaxID=2607819 RepID=UPI0013BD8365|nr:type II toxin-antitoxin system Phd/YefM family antitoxin [Moorena sp. SIO1F2]NET82766.1 type II toxin-antitoxin system Phd/YefM family antitoxin [Moorena sp. SIO1F2]
MEVINIDQAKTQLSQLLVRVQQGEKIVIANQGKPVALLSQYQESQLSKRLPGRLRGQFTVPDDFNQPDKDLIRLFEGEED